MVLAITPKQWRGLLEVTGLTAEMDTLAKELGLDFSIEGERFRARAEICMLLQRWIGEQPFESVAGLFDQGGVCWEKYQTIRELATEDIDVTEDNPVFSRIEQPGIGTYPVAGPANHFPGCNVRPPSRRRGLANTPTPS